jgi:hypothetical protein
MAHPNLGALLAGSKPEVNKKLTGWPEIVCFKGDSKERVLTRK